MRRGTGIGSKTAKWYNRRYLFILAFLGLMVLAVGGCGGSGSVSVSSGTGTGATPPQRSGGLPTGVLPSGTTSTTMSLVTDVAATCRYSSTAGASYSSMPNTFTTTGLTTHSTGLAGLLDGSTYTFYVRCADLSGNANTDDYPISFSIASSSGTGLPQRSGGAPSGVLPSGTTSTTMSLTTDIAATCKYSTTPGTSYASMANTFTTTGFTSHSTLLTGLLDGTSYTYYIRCQNLSGGANTEDYPISFSIASSAGAGLPVRSGGSPTGVLPSWTTQTTMSLTTDVDATCRYSTTPGTSYASMANTFTITGFTSHSTALTGLSAGNTYNYYVRCQNLSGGANTDDYPISFSVASGGGQSYYADPVNGSNSNDGSIGSPWRDMEYGMQHISPGDTLYLRQGTYGITAGGYIDVWTSNGDDGAPGALKTVRNYPGETATITGQVFISANYWRIEGLTFDSAGMMVANENIRISQANWANINFPADWVHDIEIVGNTFIGTYGTAPLQTWASNLLVENNDLSNITSQASHPKGLGLYICSGDNLTIRGNVIQGQGGYGIQVFDQRRASGETYERVISNVTVENNILYRNAGRTSRGIIISAQDGTGPTAHTTGVNALVRNNLIYNVAYDGILIDSGFDGVKVYNNTIYNTDTGSPGILLRKIAATFSTNVEIKNNIIDLGANYATNDHIDAGNSTGVYTIDNNLYWPGPAKFVNGASDANAIEADPLFVNPGAFDFHLQQGSGAVDTGLPLTVDVPADMEGTLRPLGAGYDIGAYESY